MGWATVANVTVVNLDSAADDPSLARTELYNGHIELQNVINGRATSNGVASLDGNTKVPQAEIPNTISTTGGVDLTLAPTTGRTVLQNIMALTPRTVAQLIVVTAADGDVAYCSNGNAGVSCLAVSRGEVDSAGETIWYRVALGAEISTT